MRPLGFVGPTFPPEVNERLQYEVLLPFMLHIIYDAFGRGGDSWLANFDRLLVGQSGLTSSTASTSAIGLRSFADHQRRVSDLASADAYPTQSSRFTYPYGRRRPSRC